MDRRGRSSRDCRPPHFTEQVGRRNATVEMIHANRNTLPGSSTHGDPIDEDEIVVIDGVPVTNTGADRA